MQLLEQKPIHVRKKIALYITISIGVVLLLVLLALYLNGSQKEKRSKNESAFLRFYATILDNAQSFFGSNRAIIKE
ncbi:MAG: hypothetical protein QG674_317 [Patescibacteria group bacterium]|jgi:hypothetical protein|nr:hypothetical protein [Patescibacteria group bacterium]